MSTKNVTTLKGGAKAREHRARLARDLAGVLSNPATPPELYNPLFEALLEIEVAYQNRHRTTPEYLFGVLEFHAKGGAR